MINLPELNDLSELVEIADKDLIQVNERARITHGDKSYPIMSFEIGCKDLDAPVLGLFGGVHGLEKVGTHFVTSYLYSLFKQLTWDDDLRSQLKTSRIVSIPLINPVGMSMNWRSNGNGVDLMRNAPIDALANNTPFLIGGHRYSNKLPWYRGALGSPMELEAKTLIDYVSAQIKKASIAITVDFHSGFGIKDRFWYPYAKTKDDYPNIKETLLLKNLIDETLTHHIYKIEPQANVYTTHGDLWDFIYDNHRAQDSSKLYLPWTLEMGSWTWVKKNPKQLLSYTGLFNPIEIHRYNRVMRRHKALVDLLFKATRNQKWLIGRNLLI